MQHEEAREIIKEILNDIKFEGNLDKWFDNIKERQQKELIKWVKECKDHKVNLIQSKKERNLIGFVKNVIN